MDDNLQEFLRIHPLQAELVACRNNTDFFRKIIKQTWTAKLNALQNAEISIPDTPLYLPDAQKWPTHKDYQDEPHLNLTEALEDYQRTINAFELLK